MSNQEFFHKKCAVIIVTHNNQPHLTKLLESLNQQTQVPDQVLIVDSGSGNVDYLLKAREKPWGFSLNIVFETNIGFCRGNNLGLEMIDESIPYVLFLNPDAFLTSEFIKDAIKAMETPAFQKCGMLTGTLLGYDIKEDNPTGKYDSTGVFVKWYGRWYDRDQGMPYDANKYSRPEKVPAICGALLFCRRKALNHLMMNEHEVFDSTFNMYKEDIDLSLRLHKAGWQIYFFPDLIAYHCRGWNTDRKEMPRHLRLLSARNEIRLYEKAKSPRVTYSLLKYAAVRFLNL